MSLDLNPHERAMLERLDQRPRPTRPAPPRHRLASDDPLHLKPRRPAMPTVIALVAIKALISIDPISVVNLRLPEGQPRTVLTIQLPDGSSVGADLSAKSVRKAIGTIREHGPDQIFCFVQGKLAGGSLVEAGVAANVKTQKETAPSD
jgi:hypothetical protein